MIRTTTGIVAVITLGLVAAACGKEKHDESSHAASGSAHHAAPATAKPAVEEHGNHDPAHGGAVLMDSYDHHAEVVLDPAGESHRVYVSDNTRRALPASTFDTVTLTITRHDASPEQLPMTRAADDSHWAAKGTAVPKTNAKVKLLYTKGGATLYDVEFPVEFILTGKMPITAVNGGIVSTIPGGHVELAADAKGAFKVWLFGEDRAPLPPAGIKVSVTTSQKDYGMVALSASGDHFVGNGTPIRGGHAVATVTVERNGQASTAKIPLHLEGAGGGHHGH